MPDRSWFERWRDPSEFFSAAHRKILSIPLARSVPNYLSEAYVAGLFACIWNDHSECKVRLIPRPERSPDSQLDEAGKILNLEIVIELRQIRSRQLNGDRELRVHLKKRTLAYNQNLHPDRRNSTH
jgi:hypothetical protein